MLMDHVSRREARWYSSTASVGFSSSHRVPGRRYCNTKIVNCIFHLGDGKAVIGFSWVSVLPILNFSGRFTVVSIDFY